MKEALGKWLYPHGTTVLRGASGTAMASFAQLLNSLYALLPVLFESLPPGIINTGGSSTAEVCMRDGCIA